MVMVSIPSTSSTMGKIYLDPPLTSDFSSNLSTDEETSDSDESNMGGATAHHEFFKLV